MNILTGTHTSTEHVTPRGWCVHVGMCDKLSCALSHKIFPPPNADEKVSVIGSQICWYIGWICWQTILWSLNLFDSCSARPQIEAFINSNCSASSKFFKENLYVLLKNALCKNSPVYKIKRVEPHFLELINTSISQASDLNLLSGWYVCALVHRNLCKLFSTFRHPHSLDTTINFQVQSCKPKTSGNGIYFWVGFIIIEF